MIKYPNGRHPSILMVDILVSCEYTELSSNELKVNGL